MIETDLNLDVLDGNQRQAVLHGSGPLLVIAGAGSGKTRVLTHRIAHLITTGRAKPEGVAAITFTNKAARELKERLQQLLCEKCEGMWIGTFHAICVRMLRAHARLLGLDPSFLIADAADQASVVKEIVKDLDLSRQDYSPGRVVGRISRAKDELLSPQAVMEKAQSVFERNLGRIFFLYEERLRRSGMLDFGDLIACAVSLLEQNQFILESYTNRIQHILVDEYQDTNHAQYVLTRLLAGKQRNLVVVGDDDQSIYGWRGADIANILEFERDYPDARTVVLDANYRSTSGIVDVANYVIARNRGRKPKTLIAIRGQGEKVHLHVAQDQAAEALFVIETAEGLLSSGMKLRDMAVLYRSHAQSRIVEDMCMKRAVPYSLVAGTRFYERKEIKDLLAYVRVSVAEDDDVSIMRIANVPRRGIGAKTIEQWQGVAAETGLSMLRVVDEMDTLTLDPSLATKLTRLAEVIGQLRETASQDSVTDVLKATLRVTDYVARMDQTDTEQWQQRVDNVEELLTIAAGYDQEHDERGIRGFLEDVALMSDVDSYEDDVDGLTLMTIHAAKGLEFPVVFVVGLDEGFLPHRMTFDDEQALEEERRLCYVAMTRARDKLYLTRARLRTTMGERMDCVPSRFLQDIPMELLRINGAVDNGSERLVFAGNVRPVSRRSSTQNEVQSARLNNNLPTGDSGFRCGDKVEHFKFGQGTVVKVEGEGDREMVSVAFPGQGIKKLMVTLARLKKSE